MLGAKRHATWTLLAGLRVKSMSCNAHWLYQYIKNTCSVLVLLESQHMQKAHKKRGKRCQASTCGRTSACTNNYTRLEWLTQARRSGRLYSELAAKTACKYVHAPLSLSPFLFPSSPFLPHSEVMCIVKTCFHKLAKGAFSAERPTTLVFPTRPVLSHSGERLTHKWECWPTSHTSRSKFCTLPRPARAGTSPCCAANLLRSDHAAWRSSLNCIYGLPNPEPCIALQTWYHTREIIPIHHVSDRTNLAQSICKCRLHRMAAASTYTSKLNYTKLIKNLQSSVWKVNPRMPSSGSCNKLWIRLCTTGPALPL